jgi:myo-inositol-1(or 4)-monophosphatase
VLQLVARGQCTATPANLRIWWYLPRMAEFDVFIGELLDRAASTARMHFGQVEGRSKGADSNQVLTDADLAIGNQLVEAVERAHPSYNIIDEEAGVIDRGSDFTWVFDPIDGTSNFAVGSPHYGTMIALLREGVPLAAGITLPSFQLTYAAELGHGCRRNGKDFTPTLGESLADALMAYGIDGHREDPTITRDEVQLLGEILLSVRNLRTSNSVYDFVMVLEGQYGAWMNRTSKIWDNVAQECLMVEAGGIYTDFYGAPISYDRPTSKVDVNFTACAGSSSIHEDLQRIVHSGTMN